MGASQLLENISDTHREHWGQTDENETNQSKIKQRKTWHNTKQDNGQKMYYQSQSVDSF